MCSGDRKACDCSVQRPDGQVAVGGEAGEAGGVVSDDSVVWKVLSRA